MRLTKILLSSVLCTGPALARQVETPTTLVHPARMLDLAEGEMVSPAVVVIRGGLIRAVNPAQVPGDADQAIDLSILPLVMARQARFVLP